MSAASDSALVTRGCSLPCVSSPSNYARLPFDSGRPCPVHASLMPMNDHDLRSAPPSEPPEDAYVRSEPHLLSPASPKPIHFPQPTNIPVLENMMDVGYNQTEAHMSDPALRNTELRPGAWRDPNDPSDEAVDHASPFSTGGDAIEPAKEDQAAVTEPAQIEVDANSNSSNPVPNEADVPHVSHSNGVSHEAHSHLQTDLVPEAHYTSADLPLPLSDPSVSAADTIALSADNAQPHSNETTYAQPQTRTSPILHPSNAPPGDDDLIPAQPPTQVDTQTPLPSAEDEVFPMSASGLGAHPSGLPPRPPPQEQPLINPHYVHSQHIRDYHPHAAHPALHSHAPNNSSAGAIQSSALPANPQQVAGGAQDVHQTQQLQATVIDSVPRTPRNLSQPFPTGNTPIESRREYKLAAGETPTVDDQPWTQDIQQKYDHFLEEERKYVHEAKWDQFPYGSRLFVGNLSSEKVTKRDIYHVFHSYGDLAQVSIKQAYGFVQFLRPEDCARALVSEQGRQIRDKRIHLEVSKPQKTARNQQNNNRRSRSPEQGGRGKRGHDSDRYSSQGRGSGHGRNRDSRDSRDGYRPGHRSPSPRMYRDRRDERYSARSRSPAYGHLGGDRYARGSPRREPEDDLPLPRRMPQDVPDVQLIILDQLDRDFIAWVEAEFSKRGIRIDTLMISPRLSEEAVVRRQILEGVLAVSRLRRHNQMESKIGLTIFKRKGALQDVQFEEYEQLDPNIACELVLREKRTLQGPTQSGAGPYGAGYQGQNQYGAQPPPQQYGYQQPQQPSYGPPAGFQQPHAQQSPYGQPPQRPFSHAGGIQQPPPNVDPNNLQNLLANLGQNAAPPSYIGGTGQYGAPAQQPGYPPQSHMQPGYPSQSPAQGYAQQVRQYGAPQQGPGAGYQSYQAPSGMASGQPGLQPPSHQQQVPGQSPANMKDVLARLGSYVP